ncbi:ABC transporter permease [Sphingobacterium daejeonense]|uniref:ABC transporter permease n=1 Tax=Sphingobacterium daejeonense TaxID=371142 RepID=A0ABW3RKC3_9SPHI|nr:MULTISPECIES: FtsX-like permease family protein [Sphingobacterium]VTP99837.1 ABC exporter transmembrane subunit, DevC protein [Sphingobacterium daejeonense]
MLGLAWKFIKFDRAKSFGIITAIVISVFLIGQQLSLLFFLMGLMGNLVNNAPIEKDEIWIIESQSKNVNSINMIDQRSVQEIASLPGISRTIPVILAPAQATFLDGKTAAITLVGTPAPEFLMGPIQSRIDSGSIKDLMQPYSVSAEYFNARSWETDLYLNKPIEINGKSAKVSVITKNAQAFGASFMYSNLENARFFGNFPTNKVSLIIGKLNAQGDKETVINMINNNFPNLRAWDANKLKSSTVKEILISSNMGMSFGTLVVFAMISGFFIIGLTLYSSALDRIKDYGTLKAIGAKNKFVNRLIIAQAFLYATIGYVLAMLLIYGFKFGVEKSGLNINVSLPFALFLLFVTMLISIGGSLFAVRKISKLEPASVF